MTINKAAAMLASMSRMSRRWRILKINKKEGRETYALRLEVKLEEEEGEEIGSPKQPLAGRICLI